MERPLLTTAEVAAALGLTHDGIKSAIKRGTLEVVHINPRLNMVTPAAMETYRRDHLGQGSWGRRRDPGKPETKAAAYARAYRERKKAKTVVVRHEAIPGDGVASGESNSSAE